MLAPEELHVMCRTMLGDIGLGRPSSCPCAVGHETQDLGMVVHGDDFIVAGCGEDLNWLSQKLDENLELVQKARFGLGHNNKAVMLNRCVMFSDTGLTWKAGPRHAELAVGSAEPSGDAPTEESRRCHAKRGTRTRRTGAE